MPPNTVVVSRPSKWGNPYDWRDWREDAPRKLLRSAAERDIWCREQAVESFAYDIRHGVIIRLPLGELRGKNLACWCRARPRFACHADVLLEVANAPLSDGPAAQGKAVDAATRSAAERRDSPPEPNPGEAVK